MKCAWSHCRHGGEVNKEDAVKKGTRYFHPDCLREKDAINEIIKVYHERVDDKPIENFLRKTINDLVFKDENSAEFLLFALNYCLDNGWSLHSPNGLRYVAKDVVSKKEWNKNHDPKPIKAVNQFVIEGESKYDATPINQGNTKKLSGFARIIGG